MRSVEFVITNPRHHLAMFLSLMTILAREDGIRVRVASFCELRGYRTPTDQITKAGAQCVQILPWRLGKDSPHVSAARKRLSGFPRAAVREMIWRLSGWPPRTKNGKPGLVVLPNDSAYPYDRIVRTLHCERIPFLLVQEGIRFALPGTANGRRYGEGGAAAVAAWGPASVRYFEGVGVDTERIHPVGNPALDTVLATNWEEAAQATAQTLGIESRALLFISNPVDYQGFCTSEMKYALVRRFLDGAASFLAARGMTLLVKIHPSESLDAYRRLASSSRAASRILVTRDAPLYALFKLAVAVVVLASTAGLEAILFDLPLAVLEMPGAGYLYDYVDKGVAVPLSTAEPLSDVLDTLLADPIGSSRRQTYVQQQIANVGRSAENMAILVRSLIEKPRLATV